MYKFSLSLLFILTGLICFCQTPTTKEGIEKYIDSIGNSNDRMVRSSAAFPAIADGTNFKWKIIYHHNKSNQLLWVEDIDSSKAAKVYFYAKDESIMISQLTFQDEDSSGKRKPVFRKAYLANDKVIYSEFEGPIDVKAWLKQGKEHRKFFNDTIE